jgi:hypothetical protein
MGWPGDLLGGRVWREDCFCWLSSQLPVSCRRAGRGSSWSARSCSAREGAGEDERAGRRQAVADDRGRGRAR